MKKIDALECAKALGANLNPPEHWWRPMMPQQLIAEYRERDKTAAIELSKLYDDMIAFKEDLQMKYAHWLFDEYFNIPEEQRDIDKKSIEKFINWVREEIKKDLAVKRGKSKMSCLDAKIYLKNEVKNV